MTARDTRAALVLGCAVAIAAAVALFPAAFGVALPQNPLAPAPVAGEGSSGWSPEPVDTPVPATPTPTAAPAGQPAGDGAPTLPSVDANLLGGVVGAILLLVAVFAVRDYRSERDGTIHLVRRVLARLELPPVGRWLGTLSRLTATALVAVGAGLGRIVGDVLTVAGTVLAAVPGIATGDRSGNGGLLSGPRVSLVRIALAPMSAAAALVGTGARSWLAGSILRERNDGADSQDGDAIPVTDASTARSDGPSSVLGAWARLESLVPITNGRARTAGEYARAAIDAGFPATPVRRLLAAFRAVRYGDRTDGGDRLASARRALAALVGGDRE